MFQTSLPGVDAGDSREEVEALPNNRLQRVALLATAEPER